MKRVALVAALLAASALVALGSGAVLADGGKGVAVKPLTPQPGDTITVKGDLLGANSEVEVRVIGSGVDVDLGEVRADAEGDFTAEFRLPVGLAPGTYQVQARGAETATTQVTVLPIGVKAEQTGAQREGQVAPTMAEPIRERPLVETVGLVALFGALAGLGLFFARTARPATSH